MDGTLHERPRATRSRTYPIAEDNAATRIIAHSGKITRNVWHVAIKTLALQALVRNKTAVFNAIGTANNRADHFTKPLPLPAF
jgi:hypothetical protein